MPESENNYLENAVILTNENAKDLVNSGDFIVSMDPRSREAGIVLKVSSEGEITSMLGGTYFPEFAERAIIYGGEKLLVGKAVLDAFKETRDYVLEHVSE